MISRKDKLNRVNFNSTIGGEIAKMSFLVDRRLAFDMDWTSGWDTDQDLSELIIPWNQG